MAAVTSHRRRLVVHAILVALQACGSLAGQLRVVRAVTTRARRVLRDRVQARQLAPLVAALARRWRGWSARAGMRAMTRRAVERSAVRGLGLVGVTRRAGRRRVTRIVRLVAARACLVSRRRGRSFVLVARRARGSRRGRCVLGIRVTRHAIGVTGVRRRTRVIGVTARAQGLVGRRLRSVRRMAAAAVGVTGADRLARSIRMAVAAQRGRRFRFASVRGVAVEARLVGVMLGLVTRLARDGLRARGYGARMNRVTPDARARRSHRMTDLLVVTARACTRRDIVRRMAARTLRVCLRATDHGLVAMARRARLDLGDAEVVRLVAAGALRVALVQRRRRDVQWTLLLRVTRRAALIGDQRALVHAMTVDAPARARVLGLLLGVALRARLRIERRRRVWVMTGRAILIGVGTDGVLAVLRSIVTPHARLGLRRGFAGAEAVTVLAARRAEAGMQRRHHRGMTARAQLGGRSWKSSIAVTVATRDLADVREVTGTGLDVLVRRGNLLRRAVIVATAPGNEHDRDDEQPRHGREPMG